jgi:hypothetical protein
MFTFGVLLRLLSIRRRGKTGVGLTINASLPRLRRSVIKPSGLRSDRRALSPIALRARSMASLILLIEWFFLSIGGANEKV